MGDCITSTIDQEVLDEIDKEYKMLYILKTLKRFGSYIDRYYAFKKVYEKYITENTKVTNLAAQIP